MCVGEDGSLMSFIVVYADAHCCQIDVFDILGGFIMYFSHYMKDDSLDSSVCLDEVVVDEIEDFVCGL
ncbi:MAG: hypothetical protein H6766_07205 [Candidatus Peribacteria bacterium]|nr:MAG: hypothetical protein H6766_07205 [Candidatus Peribacteria bacterium]